MNQRLTTAFLPIMSCESKNRANNARIRAERPKESGSRPVSRVLSWATIPLGCTSPCTSSSLPGGPRGPRVPDGRTRPACPPIWPCSGRGLPCRACCQARGALLPHRFTLASCGTALSHPAASAVCFLLHFPWTRVPQALPGASPCGARTFLDRRGAAHFYAKPRAAAVAWPTPALTIGAWRAKLKYGRVATACIIRPAATG